MANVKDLLIEVMQVLEENDCFFHDGTIADDWAYKWTDCKYVYATFWEVDEHFRIDRDPFDKDAKLLWEIDDSGYRAKPLPEMTELVSNLMFKAMLKARNN